MSQIDHARRGFLIGQPLTSEGRRDYAQKQARQGPYPPGLRAVIDAGNCIDCAQPCVDACEENIIQAHPEQHALHRQPHLVFTQRGCTFCLNCTAACPKISWESDPVECDSIGNIALNQGACLAWSGVFCMSCLGACPLKALSLDFSRKLITETDRCTGCGHCVARCPTQALSVIFAPGAE